MGMRNINTSPGVKGPRLGPLVALVFLAGLMVTVVAIGNSHTSKKNDTPTPAVSTTQQPEPSTAETFFCSTCPENNPWYPAAPPDWWKPGMPTQSPTKAG